MSTNSAAFTQQAEKSRTGSIIATLILAGLCLAFVIYAISSAWWLVPDYKARGPDAFFNEHGLMGGVAFAVWSVSLPLAVTLGVSAAAVAARIEGKRIAAFVVGGLVAIFIPMLGVYPSTSVPPVFGTGGTLISLFMLLTLWFWAKERAQLGGKARTASDLRMAGYMFFAFATWFICGMGAAAAFGLYPEKMLEFGTHGIAINLMYRILTYLVLGWGLTFAGQRVAASAANDVS